MNYNKITDEQRHKYTELYKEWFMWLVDDLQIDMDELKTTVDNKDYTIRDYFDCVLSHFGFIDSSKSYITALLPKGKDAVVDYILGVIPDLVFAGYIS